MSVRFRFRPFCSLAVFLGLTFFEIATVFAGEPQWVEVRSPNFSVVTDAGEKRGREVAMRFEQMRGVFGTLMTKANVNLPVPLQIVAFRNTKEMRQVLRCSAASRQNSRDYFRVATTAALSCSTCRSRIPG